MEEKPNEFCWFNKFDPPGCPNISKWHWPTAPTVFLKACRWCDEHKHNNDVPLESELKVRAEEERLREEYENNLYSLKKHWTEAERVIFREEKEVCGCYLPDGTVCLLREDGRIQCPFCGHPIKNQGDEHETRITAETI